MHGTHTYGWIGSPDMPFKEEAADKPEVNINFQLTHEKGSMPGPFSHLRACFWFGVVIVECLKKVKGRTAALILCE